MSNHPLLTGYAAINYAEANGAPLNKYQDPTEAGLFGLTVQEAREIASEDPSLIWIEATKEPTTCPE